MLKNKITILTSCFALSIVCGSARTHHVHAVAAVRTNYLASLPNAPLRERPHQTVRVRLIEVETNADLIDSPLADSTIIIKAGAVTLNGKTNKNGVVVFDAVPCGGEINITAKNEDGDDGVFHRRLTCARPQVDLGVLEIAFGGKYSLKQ